MSQLMEEPLESPRPKLPATPVLITAATKWEAEPLAKGLGLTRAAEGRFEGLVGGRKVVLVKTGIGAVKTAERLGRDFVAGDFGLVLSAGLCGALQDGVRTGDVVADAQELEMDFVVPLRETAAERGVRFHFGKIIHTNIVLKPGAKRKLGSEWRGVACDMETAAVKRWAGKTTPAFGVRVVLDEVDEEIPAEVPAGEDPASLAKFALTHAGQLPRLIKTGLRSGRAMKTLTRFLKAYLETI